MIFDLKLNAPGFWWHPKSLVATLLSPIGWTYGAVTAFRMARTPSYRARLPVVCIGNFVVGGAGKTPVALALCRLLSREDGHPGFLTRGYGARLTAPVLIDTGKHTAGDVGDEPMLLAAEAPTVASPDRIAGARRMEDAPVDLIVMDDGFQSPGLEKTVSLVVVDGAVGVGNGHPFPAGPLRAPLRRQLRHADAIVLLGAGEPGEAVAAQAEADDVPVFHARLVPDETATAELQGKAIIAYAGIGRPEKFRQTLLGLGASDVTLHPFADHKRIAPREAKALLARAKAEERVLATTEKDAARLRADISHGAPDGNSAHAALLAASVVVPVSCRFADEAALLAFLAERFRRSAGRA